MAVQVPEMLVNIQFVCSQVLPRPAVYLGADIEPHIVPEQTPESLEDASIEPVVIKRGEEVGRRNGDCGKQLYHQLEVRGGGETILLNPGTFDSLKAEESSGQVDYFVTNVDNHSWDIDNCGDAEERFSYVLMREE